MNVGDLVTLSARGANLENARGYRRSWNNKPKLPGCSSSLVGLVVAVEPPNWAWETELKYIIKWHGEGPGGRAGWDRHWHRCDLKYLSKVRK